VTRVAPGTHLLELEQREDGLLEGARRADVEARRLERCADLMISKSSDSALVRLQRLVASHFRAAAKLERKSADGRRKLAKKYAELRQKYVRLYERKANAEAKHYS
jgi:hypothetical protein